MFLRSLIFAAFILFISVNSFAQNSSLNSQTKNIATKNQGSSEIVKQGDLSDNTPRNKNSTANNLPAANTIGKAQIANDLNNGAMQANELVKTLLGTNKLSSLMFDDEELANVDRAIESFKNNQTYVPAQDLANGRNNELDAQKKLENDIENEKSYIYLASIIFYSPKDWAVWINNLKITSDNNKNSKELFIKEIYPDRAKIVWSLGITKWRILSGKKSDEASPKVNAKNNVEIEFILRPNQTFILGSGRIVEGRAVVSLPRNNLTTTLPPAAASRVATSATATRTTAGNSANAPAIAPTPNTPTIAPTIAPTNAPTPTINNQTPAK